MDLLTFKGVQRTRRLRPRDFLHVFYMLKYPSVLLPTIYYSLCFGFGSVMFAVTGSAAFNGVYKFGTIDVGLCIGLSTFLGTLIGEAAAGPVSDRLLYLYRKKHGGEIKPEARLHTIWPGTFLLPIGVVIEGVCLQYKTHFMGPVMGIAIGCLGLQIVSTTIFSYITDVSSHNHFIRCIDSNDKQCYKPQSAEISTLLNFGRQTFSFTLGFYCVPFAQRSGWAKAWGTFAIIDFAFFSCIVALMIRGKVWRERLGTPSFDRDL